MRGRQYRGIPESMAAYQSFIGPRSLQQKGVPFGPKSYLGDLMFFHPHTLPSNTSSISIEGVQEAGKSTLAKSMVARCSMLQAYDTQMHLEKWRTRIRSRRSEKGVAEYGPIADYLHANYFKLGKGKRINLLGLLRNPTDVTNMAVNIIQEIGGRYKDVKITPAVAIAVYRLFKEAPETVGELMIKEVLRGLTVQDFSEYRQTTRERSMVDFNKEFDLNPHLREQLNLDYDVQYIDESYVEAAQHAADCLEILMGSDYGDAFGGTTSLYNVLTQRVVLLDTEDIPGPADTILESVMMKAEATAIQYQDDTRGNADDPTLIIPHLDISDEEGVAMKSLLHARQTANKQAVQRKFPTSSWRLLQHGEIQLAQAGASGSELRSLATEIDNGYGARFIMRQANNDEILHRYSRFLSQHLVDQLPYLNQGEAVLWVNGQAPVLVQHRLTRREKTLIQTNFSRERMSVSEPVYEMDRYKDRVQRMNAVRARREIEAAEAAKTNQA